MFRLLFELNRRMPNGTYGGVRGIINLYSIMSVPGMARIQSEIDRSQVVTAKCSEPQVVDSDVRDGGSGVAILSSVRTETGYKAKWWIRLLNKPKSKR